MDLKESKHFEKSNSHLGSKSTELGVDFKNFDVQLDKHLAKIWSKEREIQEEWEIDLTKLDVNNVIANHGIIVYKGVYDGQDVVVKVLDWSDGGGVTAAKAFALRATFEREVAVWYKLDHPNVTKLIGASVGILDLEIPSNNDLNACHKPLPYRACCVVVEYLQGGNIKNFLIRNSRKKLSFKMVIQFALDLSRGLSYLHSKKIVHREVKTENMLLDTIGTLKIADFGVARVGARNCRDMTRETGTLGYMAPEVLEGKPYNRKSDVYSLGICLWEIYCCDTPYADLSFDEVSSAVIHQNLRPNIPKCCPSSFESILKKCWDANPEKRPVMEEIVKLLEAVDTSKGGGMVSEDDEAPGCFCFLHLLPPSPCSLILFHHHL